MKGKEWENHCMYRFSFLKRQRLGTMSRYGTVAITTGPKRPCKRCGASPGGMDWVAKQSMPDFEGVFGTHGRQFIAEAKVCAGSSVPIHVERKQKGDGIKVSQKEHLLHRAEFRAVSMVWIHWPERVLKTRTDPMATFAFPVIATHPFWVAHAAGDKLRITRDDCHDWGVEIAWNKPSERAQDESPDLMPAIEACALIIDQYHGMVDSPF